jgi:hypothetical protein
VKKIVRTASGAVVALVLAIAAAAPAAAAQPIKDTFHDLQGFTIPAGYACPFDVEGSPDFGFSQRWIRTGEPLKGAFHAHGAYVNDATGARYETLDNFSFEQWTDPITGLLQVVLQGQGADSFLPGDVGPFGTVGENGAFYDFVGRITFTIDPVTGHVSRFSWAGTATDICAALS